MIDNLTEAISHAKKVAIEKREEEQALRDRKDFIESNERNPKGIYDVPINQCKECAAEHEQLAEWLIELNNYRQSKSGCSKCKYNGDIGGDYIRHAQTTEGTIYKNKYDGSLRFVKKNPKCVGCCTTVSRHFEPKAPESEAENE